MTESVRSIVRPRLGIDTRALGAFRILLGLLILVDLALYRLPGLVTFYTDVGVFPRSTLAEVYPTFAAWSIHALSGAPWFQGLLVAITGLFALFLLVGCRTRLATGVLVVLLGSLHARNPHLTNGGDTILLTFLFLGLFLPLDARWAYSTRRTTIEQHICSIATATILLHFVFIYTLNGILKYQSEEWMSGRAVPQIFQLEEYFVLLGPHLGEYTTLLTVFNWLWVGLLTTSIFLVVYTGRLRIGFVAAFVFAQLGMAATMRLGIFPFVMIAGLLLFLPPAVWDRADKILQNLGPNSVLSVHSEQRDTTGPVLSEPIPARVRQGIQLGSSLLLVCFLVAIVIWQGAAAGLVDSPSPELAGELSEGSWAFFAPNPPDGSSWYVIEAELESGDTTDLVAGGDVTFDRPPDVAAAYPMTLWMRYGAEVRYADRTYYEPIAAYSCAQTDRDVESVTIYHVVQPVASDGPAGDPSPAERIRYSC